MVKVHASKPGELKKVDMEQRAERLEAKKARGKKSKRSEKAKENRKITTERVNKRS